MNTLRSLCLAILLALVAPAQSQVYSNPSVNANPPPAASINPNLITQTVYGFLDFTTTIGNTVMVFSPNSASHDAPTTPSVAIETKPTTPTTTNEIKPSKTIPKITPSKPKAKQISSEVHMETSSHETLPTPAALQKKPIYSKVNVVENTKSPRFVISSHVDVVESKPSILPHKPQQIFSSVVEVYSDDDASEESTDNDLFSKQPSQFVEEVYHPAPAHRPAPKSILKARPNVPVPAVSKKPQHQAHPGHAGHPTGLVTKMTGTVVQDGQTTVHETSVIGTYISGKYAQVLQSTSKIFQNPPKIRPTSSLRILKTAAPTFNRQKSNLDPTPASVLQEESIFPVDALYSSAPGANLIRASRRPSVAAASNFKNKFKSRNAINIENAGERLFDGNDEVSTNDVSPKPKWTKTTKTSANRPIYKAKTATTKSEPSSTEPTTKRGFQPRKSVQKTSSTSSESNRRGYKPRVQASAVDNQGSTSLYKFKLNRSPGRWQYKTTPKPRVTILKKQVDETAEHLTSSSTSNPGDYDEVSQRLDRNGSEETDLESSGSAFGLSNVDDENSSLDNKIEQPLPVETLKVEISAPSDLNDVYYEIATIKSPYTFQVGNVKNTRFLTVTSTIEKTFSDAELKTTAPTPTEPLTENILATKSIYDKDHLDTSIATLPPIHLAADMATPPLETFTETFSTTQEMLKTHILPVIQGENTTTYSLIQTYQVTRIVTATKTLPPMEVYQFVPSKTLNEFNSRLDEAGSELHLELEYGDNNDDDDAGPKKYIFPSDLNLANVGSDFNLSEVDPSRFPEGPLRLKKANTPARPETTTPSLSADQLQQLALLRYLNPQGLPQSLPQVVTSSKPVVKLETIFESHVVPLFNGVSTIYSTISKPVSTVTRTEYELSTSTIAMPQIPPFPNQQFPNQPFPNQPFPNQPFPNQQQNPLFPNQPQFTIVSTPIVTQTMATETNSKVLKLTFGAKTTYTTLYSTKVVPTEVTTYLTTSVPVQPTLSYPGFFPAPFAPYPFVG